MSIVAVSYVRVSGKGQADGDGPDRQRDAIARYATAHGIEIVEEFADLGVSGTVELANRDGLARLLARVETNCVRLVLVERADRLARDLIVGERILEDFRNAGAKVIEADGGNELTVGDGDPTRKLIRQVLGAVAEYDKTVTVLKMQAARQRLRQRGERCEGEKPFGQRAGEAEILARLLALSAQGMGATAIARQLNAEKRPTRKGGQWSRQIVDRILEREPNANGL